MGDFSHRGGAIGFLNSIGYRYDTPSFQEVVDTRQVEQIYAYCNWYECKPRFKNHLREFRRRCPACGHELVWKKKPEIRDQRRIEIENCNHRWADFSVIKRERGYSYFKIYDRWEYSQGWKSPGSDATCADCGVKKSLFVKGWDFW